MYFASPEKEGVKKNIIIFAFLSLLLLLIDTYDKKYFKYLKSAINDTIIYSAVAIKYPFQKIFDVVASVSNVFDDEIITEDVEKLKQELTTLQNKNQTLNLQLKKLQNIVNEEQYDYDFINSKVLMYKKNLLSDSILISKGSAQGVKAGDPIVRENRLVGKIIEVNYASSQAILLTNIRSRIPVNVGEKSIRAILVGNPNVEGGISLEFLPKNVKFSDGDKIFTSSIDQIVPAGILVGSVKNIKDKFIVELAFQNSQLDYVTIMSLKKWQIFYIDIFHLLLC